MVSQGWCRGSMAGVIVMGQMSIVPDDAWNECPPDFAPLACA